MERRVNRARDDEALEGVVIDYPRDGIPYPSNDLRLPRAPTTRIRRGGFLGLGLDHQDVEHERRLREIEYLGTEIRTTEGMGLALDYKGVKDAIEASEKVEALVLKHEPHTLAARVGADLAGEMVARTRARHSVYQEVFDAEAMNTLNRG
jgi:hypothetical protein